MRGVNPKVQEWIDKRSAEYEVLDRETVQRNKEKHKELSTDIEVERRRAWFKAHDEKLEKGKQSMKQVKELFRSLELEVDIEACGCCDSPSVTVRYKGETIVDDQDNFSFRMTKEREDED